MELIKKYYIYGVYVLIVLASLGLYAWGMMKNNANIQEYNKINSQYSSAMSLQGKAVHENEIKFHNDNIARAEEDKKAVIDFCRKTSSRPYLFINVFPSAPQVESKQYYMNFAEKYCEGVDNILKIMRAGNKPSELEESNYLEKAKRTTETGADGMGMGMRGERGGMGGYGAITAGSSDDKLRVEMRENRANEISIYSEPESFVLYSFWKEHDGSTGTPATLQFDSWYSQIAYWIQEDVAFSINKINDNTNSSSVKKNPIKRLIEVSFGGPSASTGSGSAAGTMGGGMRGMGRGDMMVNRGGMTGGMGRGSASMTAGTSAQRTGSTTALPAPVSKGAAAPGMEATGTSAMQNSMTTSWTKRASDELTDVFHFSVSVIVASDRVNDFINALQSPRTNLDGTNSRNQITVLQFNVNPVNIQAEEAAGYYYGAGALVQVDTICEYVFFRSGYEAQMPDIIKKGPEAAVDTPVTQPTFDANPRGGMFERGRGM